MKKLLSFSTFIKLIIAGAVLVSSLGFTTAALAQSTCGATYTIQRGDYLTKIARNCGVTYRDLIKANPQITNPSRVYPGQVINIPQGGSIPVTGSKPGVYTVKQGDTLFSIGQAYGVSVADLRAANALASNNISVGQLLNIPARISFASGGTAAAVSGQIGANSRHAYLLNASANQTLEVTLNAPAGFTLAIYGADGVTVKAASSTLTFRGVLPRSQDYALVISSGGSAADYSLSVDVPRRISFASGATSASLTGTVPANLSQYFILRASNGQTLNVTATPDNQLQLTIYGVDGTVLKSGMGEGASFSGTLPSTQDYILVLKSANQAVSFTLNVSIPAGSIPVTGTSSYTVQRGDTLSAIARRFSTTVTVLMRANPEITNSNSISVGQVIYLPGARITLSNGKIVYVTKSGDTMGAIAREFNTTLTALVNANPQISNPNLIYTGQRINIP
jgi:LysM repeat protein